MAQRPPCFPTTLPDAALNYAARGWRVIPLHSVSGGKCSCSKPDCGSAGKHPRTAHGCKDGTTDPDIIRGWWSRWPDANIGVCTGAESGIVMLGPDGDAGIMDLANLEEQFGYLPDTPTAKSGSGGRHLLFRHPGDRIPNRKNHRGMKIDVRGDGGYFVAVPSANAGGPYVWETDPDMTPVADLPPWLANWILGTDDAPPPPDDPLPYRPTSGRNTYERAIKYVSAMPGADGTGGHGGHDATLWAARACFTGFALSEDESFRLLAEHFNPRCTPPWTEKDLRRKVSEVARLPSRHTRGYLLADNDSDRSKTVNTPTGRTSTPDVPEFEFVDLSTMKARPVKWVVPGRIPRGTLCLIAGYGGSGKSTITRHLAARITSGRTAFGLTYDPDPPGDVLLIAAEDDYETSVVPHLIAEGADLTRIRQVFKLQVDKSNRRTRVHLRPDHLIELRDHLATLATPPRLLIVDPVASFASKGNINEARAAEVRAILDPLSELAQETGMAVLVVAHLNKSANHGPASNRVAGSRAYIDAARLAYCVDANPDEPDQRLLMPVKANIFGVNKQTAPFALQRIEEDAANALRSHPSVSDLDDADFAKLLEHLGTVRFGSDVDVSADDVFGGRSTASATKAESCAAWLREFVSEYAYPSVEVEKAAANASFGLDCLKRAKAKLKADGLRHKKDEGTGGVWWCGWGPPETWVRRSDPAAAAAACHKPTMPCTSSTSSSPSTYSLFSLSKEEEEGEEVQEVEQVEQVDPGLGNSQRRFVAEIVRANLKKSLGRPVPTPTQSPHRPVPRPLSRVKTPADTGDAG